MKSNKDNHDDKRNLNCWSPVNVYKKNTVLLGLHYSGEIAVGETRACMNLTKEDITYLNVIIVKTYLVGILTFFC